VSEELFKICGELLAPGQKKTVNLSIGRLYTGADLSIPIWIKRGRKQGPILFVSGAIHGDEINGVEIIRRLIRAISKQPLSGTLIAIPVVNVLGFLNHSRYLPDRRDLNRYFPGTPTGSLTSKLANIFITEIVTKCTHGIDLHTGSNHRSNLPHLRARLSDPQTRDMAQAFGAPVILDSSVRDGSLREAVSDLHIPMLLFEGGEALRFNEHVIRTGLRGVLSVMHSIGMIKAKKKIAKHPPLIVNYHTWTRANKSGILTTGAKLGDVISVGKKIAQISDPFGEETVPVHANCSGIIIGKNNIPLVHHGDALFHIASAEKLDEAEETIELFQEMFFPTEELF